MFRLMGEVSDEISSWEYESSGTEQSFCTARAAVPSACRKPRFIERFESVKLTEKNLATLQADYKRVPPRPASPVDSEFRFDPSPGTTTYRIKRKPLPDSAREALQQMKDETEALQRSQDDSLAQDSKPSTPDCSPFLPRSNTNFTDFVPYHQVRTWQQVDNEEYLRRRAHSLSAIALNGIKKLSPNRDNLSMQSKKTAAQLKEIKRRVID
jgi:hypothetical protein